MFKIIDEKKALAEFLPLAEDLKQYHLEFIKSNWIIKLNERDNEVVIGMSNVLDNDLIHTLEQYHRKPLVLYKFDRSEIASVMTKDLSSIDTTESLNGDDKMILDQLANDAPVVNLVNTVFIEAIRRNASDIHFEVFSDDFVIRYRIDGSLVTVHNLPKSQYAAVSSRIKIMANLNIMERRLPQDGRITVNIDDDAVDLRVSIIPIAKGESIVCRIFNKESQLHSLDTLGFDSDSLKALRKAVSHPHGMVLVTGPTGSGKTTTLNALLREVQDDALKIITIEDPVEYVIDGINQIQTNEKIGLTFDHLLRRVLRQDPNIIMIGEIRDVETAELAIRAALTGHLVLSTLHTNDAASVIQRLINMGIESYMIAAVLKGVFAQRLIRRVCPHCYTKEEATESEKKLGKEYGKIIKTVPRAVGCSSCSHTGYSGRLIISEYFLSNKEVENAILDNESLEGTEVFSKMQTLAKSGLDKVLNFETTLEELGKAVML